MPLRGACGGKVPLPSAPANAPPGACGGKVPLPSAPANAPPGACGGKVPLPSAPANAPPGGVRAASTGEHWSVSKAIYYIRPNNYLCGT